MDPFDCFRNAEYLHCQYIFNIIQHFNNRVKFFDIRLENEYNLNHIPMTCNIPPQIISLNFSIKDLSRLTDTTTLRRQCIIIASSPQFNQEAEQIRKLLMKHKCKEIHMLKNIEEFIYRYSFLTYPNRIKEYPNEIIPMFLYIGSEDQAHNPQIIRNLKITHILNATTSCKNIFEGIKYCKVIVHDKEDEKISRYFQKAYEFIEEAMHENQMGANNVVLVHCALGVSRSVTIVIMFLMRTFGLTLQESLDFIKCHRHRADPNPGFIKQLEQFHIYKYKFSKTLAGKSLEDLE